MASMSGWVKAAARYLRSACGCGAARATRPLWPDRRSRKTYVPDHDEQPFSRRWSAFPSRVRWRWARPRATLLLHFSPSNKRVFMWMHTKRIRAPASQPGEMLSWRWPELRSGGTAAWTAILPGVLHVDTEIVYLATMVVATSMGFLTMRFAIFHENAPVICPRASPTSRVQADVGHFKCQSGCGDAVSLPAEDCDRSDRQADKRRKQQKKCFFYQHDGCAWCGRP